MPRYFIEVSYKGTAYSGFQVQKNANTIQAEVEKALEIYFKKDFSLTGSSRTDAGVHALQNYFHFDTEQPLINNKNIKILQTSKAPSPGGDLGEAELQTSKVSSPGGDLEEAFSPGGDSGEAREAAEVISSYHLNAILPKDIVIKRIFEVEENAHCRFDAITREYKYFIYRQKDPFLQDRAFYFPYKLGIDRMNEAAELLLHHKDFTSFSKRNTQVNNFICNIKKSKWIIENGILIYNVKANRFLRGMVKGLAGTMLRVGRGKLSLIEFQEIIVSKDGTKADFSVPSRGLFLVSVKFEEANDNHLII